MRKEIIYKKFCCKAILLVCICITITAYSYSQKASQITFEKFLGQPWEEGNCVRQTSDGGYIILGTYHGDGSLIVGVIRLIKTDSLGNEEWNKSFGIGFTWGTNLEITKDSGYIICGGYLDYSNVESGALLLKTNSDGEIEWFQVYDSLISQNCSGAYGYCVKQVKDSAYIMIGTCNNSEFIVKTDSIGNILWELIDTGLGIAWGKSIIEDEIGNYIALGSTYISQPTTSLMYLLKINSNGSKIWNKTFNWDSGNGNTTGYSIKINNNEYFLFGTGMYAGNTTGEMLLIKTDTSGNVKWKKSYQNYISEGYDFDITSDGGFALVGDSYNPITNNSDVYLIKTDSIGTQQWFRTIGDAGWDWGNSIRQTNDNGFIITGVTHFNGSIYPEIYLVKTNDTGGFAMFINQTLVNDVSFININPNPVINDGFNISFQIIESSSIIIKLYDHTGKDVCFIRNENQSQGYYKKYISTK